MKKTEYMERLNKAYDSGYQQCVKDFISGTVYDVATQRALPLPDIPLVVELRALQANTPEGIAGWKHVRHGAEVMVASVHGIIDRHQDKIEPFDPR